MGMMQTPRQNLKPGAEVAALPRTPRKPSAPGHDAGHVSLEVQAAVDALCAAAATDDGPRLKVVLGLRGLPMAARRSI